MTETELQAEIKRLKVDVGNLTMQLNYLKQQSLGVGNTFAGMVRELLLAIGDPADVDQVSRAKRHAKELLKQWDLMNEPPPPQPQGNPATPLAVVPTPSSDAGPSA